MNCSDVEGRLDRFQHGELPASETRAVEAHLIGCEQCSTILSLARDISTALLGVGPASPPPDLAERAARMALSAPAPARPVFLDVWLRFAWQATAVAVLMALLLFALSQIPVVKDSLADGTAEISWLKGSEESSPRRGESKPPGSEKQPENRRSAP